MDKINVYGGKMGNRKLHLINHGGFYTPEEVKELLQSPNFNANCQLVAYFYSMLSIFTDAFEKAQTE